MKFDYQKWNLLKNYKVFINLNVNVNAYFKISGFL